MRVVEQSLHAVDLAGSLDLGDRLDDELIDASISPMLGQLDQEDERRSVLTRLVAQSLSTPNQEFQRAVREELKEAGERYFQAFHRALPHLPPDELRWRMRAMIVVAVLGQADEHATHLVQERSRHARAWMLTFLTAGMCAPATTAPEMTQTRPERRVDAG